MSIQITITNKDDHFDVLSKWVVSWTWEVVKCHILQHQAFPTLNEFSLMLLIINNIDYVSMGSNTVYTVAMNKLKHNTIIFFSL